MKEMVGRWRLELADPLIKGNQNDAKDTEGTPNLLTISAIWASGR